MKPKVGVGIFYFFFVLELYRKISYPSKEDLMNLKASPFSLIEEIMNLIISSTAVDHSSKEAWKNSRTSQYLLVP